MNVSAGALSCDLLARVIHAAETPVLVLDTAGRVNFVNPAYESSTGLRGKMRLGMKLSRFCRQDDARHLDAYVVSAQISAEADALPPIDVMIDDPKAIQPCRIRVLSDSVGTHIGFACEVDAASVAGPSVWTVSEERCRIALEGADQAVWEMCRSFRPSFVTDSWFHLRGHDPVKDADAVSTWLDRVHRDDLSALKDCQTSLARGETDSVNWQYRYRHAKGHWIWILCRGRVLSRDAQGRPVRSVGTDTDVSMIVSDQAQKNILSNRLQLSLEVSGAGIWDYDVARAEVHWDERVRAIYGIDDGLDIRPNNDWNAYIHPDDKVSVISQSEECFDKMQNFDRDYRIVRPDGQVRHVRSRAKYVHAVPGSGPRFIGVNFDITEDVRKTEELEVARAAMEHDSRHDALTGLANRRKLDEVYAEFINDQSAAGQIPDFAILNIDLDHFKEVNDTHGHSAGDSVLNYAAKLLAATVADQGMVARIGGDEFVAFLPGVNAPNQLADITREILQKSAFPCVVAGQNCHFGMSIGVASNRDIGAGINNAFVAADLALYQAKQAGRGCARFYERSMRPVEKPHMFRSEEIVQGLKMRQFKCDYLPQVSAKTRNLVAVEAKVRWEHPTLGTQTADSYAADLEAAGLMADLHDEVLRTVLSDQANWAGSSLKPPRVAIKVAARLLCNPDFATSLDGISIKSGQVSFELTETTFIDETEAVLLENLRVCRSRGIEIDIDDFGSRCSSVVSVLKIAPKRIKIDRALIASIRGSKTQRKIVKAIVGIAKMTGAEVVAKGIQNEDHAIIAANIGCDILQGEWFGPARTKADLRHSI